MRESERARERERESERARARESESARARERESKLKQYKIFKEGRNVFAEFKILKYLLK